MGGNIGVETELGKGSTFWVALDLPVIDPLPAEPADARAALRAGQLPVLRPSSLEARFRVLIAEDNVVNRKILENMVDHDACEVFFAEDGRSACEAFCRDRYDLVLMDISMPGMDGVEATKAMRAHEVGRGVPPTPVVALTAHAMKGDRERFLEAGMNDYLTKPVGREALFHMMSKWLERPLPVDRSDTGLASSRRAFPVERHGVVRT